MKLPAEIRQMILDMVAETYSFLLQPYARAGYASVCREWQPFFEYLNFQHIILDQTRIPDFRRYFRAKHRQGYLKNLLLCVKLENYDCTVCHLHESPEEINRYSKILFAHPLL